MIKLKQGPKMAGLEEEFKFYMENKADFHKKHSGKYLVIKEKKIIGIFDSAVDAVTETRR
jgi:hypothetical protein